MGIILHEALKTGPLSSEAQGLDLSVNIAGGGSPGALHVAGLKLMLDLRTALLREVFLAGPGGVGIDAVASLGTCEAVRVEVGVRANVVFVGGFLAVLWDGHGLFFWISTMLCWTHTTLTCSSAFMSPVSDDR
jgi:hypothetical protein